MGSTEELGRPHRHSPAVGRPAGTVDFKRSQARSYFDPLKPFRYHAGLDLDDPGYVWFPWTKY